MRTTSECDGNFPFNNSLLCYIYMGGATLIQQIPNDISFEDAYKHSIDGRGQIVVTWPGKYRTDAFIVDDLTEFAEAKGLIKTDLPVNILGYKENREYSTRFTKCIDVEYERTDIDPSATSLADWPMINDFPIKMRKLLEDLYGWTFAVSKGGGWHESIDNKNSFTVYVKN